MKDFHYFRLSKKAQEKQSKDKKFYYFLKGLKKFLPFIFE